MVTEILTAIWLPVGEIAKHPELLSTPNRAVRVLVRHIQDGQPRTDWGRFYQFFGRWTVEGYSGIQGLAVTHFLAHKFEN